MDALPQSPIFAQWFSQWRSTLSWQPNDQQQQAFQGLYDAILSGNQRLNLTRITEPEDFWEKHLWDSLRGIYGTGIPLSETARLIDIGTGGGFQGLPIAIAQPHWQLTLVDSTRKKINFIQETAQQLGLSQVKAIVSRAEELGQERAYRERYDIATIRAVATANVCAEYVLPLVKVGGWAILYRGQWTPEENQALQDAIAQLGGTVALAEDLRHLFDPH